MKKSKMSFWGTVRLIFALVILIGSMTFLSPCVHADGSPAPCQSAGQMQIILGAIMAVLSLGAIICNKTNIKKWVAIAMIPLSLLTALTPGTLFSLCMMGSMRCNAVMKPSIILLASVVCLISIVEIFSIVKGAKKA